MSSTSNTGVLTGPTGVPVADRVLADNTGDLAAFTAIVGEIKTLAGTDERAMVGAQRHITAARIQA